MLSISNLLALSPLSRVRRTMADGTPSRRMVVKGLLAAVAAGVPAGIDLDPAAARRRRNKRKRKNSRRTPLPCSGDSCDGTGGKPCGKSDTCQCYRWAKGGNVCASSLQSSCEATCEKDRDCPRGHVCVEGGSACCGSGARFCKVACYA